MKTPNHTEEVIRFGCGFSFGLFVGFLVIARYVYHSFGWIAGITFFVALVCGLLAVKLGDKFWYSLKSWLPWL